MSFGEVESKNTYSSNTYSGNYRVNRHSFFLFGLGSVCLLERCLMRLVLNKGAGLFLSLASFDADRELLLVVSWIGFERDTNG